MVSFFGLKFGEKKNKPAGNKQQPKKIDQTQLGESRAGPKVDGSIRSVQRPGTAVPGRAKSPLSYDTHNLAAASMQNLASPDHVRTGSNASTINMRAPTSEANIRAKFGAYNGSSSSLAAPAPGFSSNYRKNSGSSPSLGVPGPGFGAKYSSGNGSSKSLALPDPAALSRPGTPNGKKPAWVNPLDVHFVKDTPSAPTTPKSPLAGEMHLPLTPRDDATDTDSVFGEDADDMVNAVMESVKMEAEEAKRLREKEKEAERQKETARLEKEKQERQKATETKLSVKPSPQLLQQPGAQGKGQGRGQHSPHGQQQHLPPRSHPQQQQADATGLGIQGPVFRGNVEQRPGSRGGTRGNGLNGHANLGPVFRGNADQRPSSRGEMRGCGPGSGLNGQGVQGPVFLGSVDQRPGSRGGMRSNGMGDTSHGPARANHAHQGPPRHSPPTQSLPQPPNQGTPRHGPRGPSYESPNSRGPQRPDGLESNMLGPRTAHQNTRPYSPAPRGPSPRAPGPVVAQRAQSPANNGPRPRAPGLHEIRPQSPTPRHQRGPGPLGYRSESPAPLGHHARGGGQPDVRSQSPALSIPSLRGPSGNEIRSLSPAPSNLGPNGYRRQESGSTVTSPISIGPSLRDLIVQSPEPLTISPTGSVSKSDDEGPIEQFARPVIQSVQARRDTLTMSSPRRHSLSMQIEKLEKTLVSAQQGQVHEANKISISSSRYSDAGADEEPILTLQPAPLRASPSVLAVAEAAVESQRAVSPGRGPLALRRGPRRPTLDEYGVGTSQTTTARPRDLSPAAALTVNTISQPSRANTPQFQLPSRALSPALTADPSPVFRPAPSPIIDVGFKFDFGPAIVAPPTPDSTVWPMPPTSPTSIRFATSPELLYHDASSEYTSGAEDDDDSDILDWHPDPELPQPKEELPRTSEQNPDLELELKLDILRPRPQAPPPLTFNFSPDAYSREPGPWTPPLRTPSENEAVAAQANDVRPSTAQDAHLNVTGGLSPGFAAGGLLVSPGSGPPSRSRSPVDGINAEEAAAAAVALGIGMARGPSVREPGGHQYRGPGAMSRRPPGMVDAFGTGFI
ncbi:hypothetical protein B0H67DRAFT_28350 [Lasiosphaeris hirsuta]|uniref:Uncharacterized protein n=1 Tax=Lasiosphaeris hirsuta TaxID=260670 RepID=A0AA40B9W0_9PEZI|nr:hypothetical protein B0H67DRAFT_28350 [Lasiosphaeris hirsuta]